MPLESIRRLIQVLRKIVQGLNSSKLLTNSNIKNYIDERLKKIEDESIVKATEVMKYLTKVMTSEEVVIACEGGYAKVDKTQSEKDRLKAAELLGKRYRLFINKVEQTVDATVNSTKKLDSILGQLGEEDE